MNCIIIPQAVRELFMNLPLKLLLCMNNMFNAINFSAPSVGVNGRGQVSFSSGSPKVCIVGSGPAGFYTAQHLIKVFPVMGVLETQTLGLSDKDKAFSCIICISLNIVISMYDENVT